MKVILIGYRATGKSAVGQYLSKKLKIPFVDTDQLVEESAEATIREIVARDGWPAFRQREKNAVASLCERGLCVVSTGGGVILAEENRQVLHSQGIVIYLQASVQDILERLARDAREDQTRPQFTDGSLADETNAVLAERIPLYESAANLTVDTAGKSVVRVAEEIYEQLLERGVVSAINKAKKKDRK